MSSRDDGALTYLGALKQVERILNAKFGKEARYEAEALLADYLDISKPKLYANSQQKLSPQVFRKLEDIAKERSKGIPLQYLLGWSEFLGLRLEVNSNVLIPRLDSESMVMEGIEHLQSLKLKAPKVLDLGAGSGALGMAVLNLLPNAELVSVDTSSTALEVLKRNTSKFGFAKRLKAFELDLNKESSFVQLAELNDGFDLILANPPYIDPDDPDIDANVKTHEPSLALFASELGLEKIIKWSQKATDLLSSKGIYFCERGWKQGPKVTRWFSENVSKDFVFRLHKDLSGNDRYFSLRSNNNI